MRNYLGFTFILLNLFVLCLSRLLNPLNPLNPSIYDKIINWYEKSQNETWSGIYFNSYITPKFGIDIKNQMFNIVQNNKTDVFVVIDTDGGDLLATYEIIHYMDWIRNKHKTKFHCVCIKTYSSGFFIFQLCDYRYWINSISIMMAHEPKLNIKGSFDYVIKYLNNNFLVHNQNYKTILHRIITKSSVNLSEYQNKIANTDWYIRSISDIYKYNFADFYFNLI